MAYMSQEKKKELLPAIKSILKKYNSKGTLSVRNLSTIVLTITHCPIDLVDNHMEAVKNFRFFGNRCQTMDRPDYLTETHRHHIENGYTGEAKKMLLELFDTMNVGNWDKSDSQTDYYNVGWYSDIYIGRYKKPLILS